MEDPITYKTDLENPTEPEILKYEELKEAARKGDETAREELRDRENRRRSGMPDHYYISSILGPDGKNKEIYVMAPYYRARRKYRQPSLWKGAIVALLMAGILGTVLVKTNPTMGWSTVEECIADLLIVAGTFFTGKGAFLGLSATRWLTEMSRQHRRALNKQINPRSSEVTRQLIGVLDKLKEEITKDKDVVQALVTVRSGLSESLKTSSSGFHNLRVLTQLDIAELFLDASNGAVLGSLLIIGGTLLLALVAVHRG